MSGAVRRGCGRRAGCGRRDGTGRRPASAGLTSTGTRSSGTSVERTRVAAAVAVTYGPCPWTRTETIRTTPIPGGTPSALTSIRPGNPPTRAATGSVTTRSAAPAGTPAATVPVNFGPPGLPGRTRRKGADGARRRTRRRHRRTAEFPRRPRRTGRPRRPRRLRPRRPRRLLRRRRHLPEQRAVHRSRLRSLGPSPVRQSIPAGGPTPQGGPIPAGGPTRGGRTSRPVRSTSPPGSCHRSRPVRPVIHH